MICTNKRSPKRLYIWAAFSVPIVISVIGCHHQDSVGIGGAQAQQPQNFLVHTQQAGVLGTSDHARLIKIQTILYQSHQMSDADLDFWIELLRRGPLKNNPSAWAGFHTLVLEDALGHKQLSSSQQTKMYDAVLPYASDAAYTKDADPSDPHMTQKLRTGDEQTAIALLAQTHDARALEVLAHIAQSSPYPNVRGEAQDLHDKLAKLPQ